jgi:hypothetical protein
LPQRRSGALKGENEMDDKNFKENVIRCQIFSGKMNMMANSIDLLVSVILEKLGLNSNRKPLGPKVGGTSCITFRKNGSLFIFDPEKIAEIDREFAETMTNLTEIWNEMLK